MCRHYYVAGFFFITFAILGGFQFEMPLQMVSQYRSIHPGIYFACLQAWYPGRSVVVFAAAFAAAFVVALAVAPLVVEMQSKH